MPLTQFLPAEVFAFMAVFTRLGAAFTVMPFFGEAVVPARLRLMLALAITLVVVPIVRQTLPPMPTAPGELVVFVFTESVIGFFLGGIARLLMTTLDLAGTVIAAQIGLSAANTFNPALQTGGTPPSILLSLGGLLAIIETNLHHMLLEGVVDSYTLFKPTDPLPVGDLSQTVTRLVGASFKVGLQLAMPFIVLSLLFTFALGLISRLMPALQIFFVSVPAQIIGGILIMIVAFSGMMTLFLTYFHETLVGLVGSR
ncbi:MAG: flagellar type III secretion system protein FliR [Alphaproteobacteria bacterium]|nr:flagellar type III secretion system protein FliR [Alphaproteobacteria bacterium]